MITQNLSYWENKASSLVFKNQAFIDGEFVDAQSSQTYDVINPATNALLASVAACNQMDADNAVSNARSAFESGSWSGLSPSERKAVVLRLAALITENCDELALLESLDMGKPVMDAVNIDIGGAAAILEHQPGLRLLP